MQLETLACVIGASASLSDVRIWEIVTRWHYTVEAVCKRVALRELAVA